MKFKTLLFTLGLFIFLGCKDPKLKNTSTEIKKVRLNDFKVFLKKFKVLELPITIKPLEIGNFESFIILDKKDFKFINLENVDSDTVYAYGILPDTIKSYKLIYLMSHQPILITFDKSGKKIDAKNLAITGCKSSCGFICSQKITFFEDLSIYSGNYIKSYDCVSRKKTQRNTKRYYRFKLGNVNSKGKIYLSQVIIKSE